VDSPGLHRPEGDRSDDSSTESALRLFSTDKASQALGMQLVSAAAGAAEMRMTIRADMANGHGTCHGGFIFMLADSAFAFACNCQGPPTVAAGATIDFLRPAKVGDVLTATAREAWRGKQSGVYDIVVVGQDQRIIALFRGRSHQLVPARVTTQASPS